MSKLPTKRKKKSSDYGKPVWVTHDIFNQLDQIVSRLKRDGKDVSVADVIGDLLALRKVPKFILTRMREESDIHINKAYMEILKFMTDKRKKK